jgi:crotonobetainyl-CoA:carnitine CoA-transferase CaiB-like acyl-CoA transferase
MTGVLDGIAVLEMPAGVAGAMAGMLLADNGADVIKVEGVHRGPIWCPTVWDRGKRSVVVDESDVRRLAAGVDVVIDDGRLDHAELASANPGLILCSITAYGRGTRHSGRPNVDALVAARMGLHWDQRGFVDGQPVRIGGLPPAERGPVPDGAEQTGHREGPIFQALPWNSFGACLLAVTGISAALRARELTGEGQWVETSLLQGGLLNAVPTWQRVPDPRQDGYRLPYFDRRCPKGFFQCADGLWLHQWAPIHHSFAQAAAAGAELHMPDMTGSERAPSPSGYAAQLATELAEHPRTAAAFAKFPRHQWIELFAAAGLPAQPVLSPEEGLLDPYARADGCVAEVVDRSAGPTWQVGLVYRMSVTPGSVGRPAPVRGEHTAEVLAAPPAVRVRPRVRQLDHALEGITVLDLGLAMAGPYGAQMLADLGADVIKVNNVTERGLPVSSPVAGCNRGKRSIAINLKDPLGLSLLHRMMGSADVIHHNMRFGAAERLGADYETARRLNPRVVYCHTRGFEASGPRAHLPGNDQMGQALAGTWWEMGACAHGRPPSWHPAALGDFGNGVMSAVAVIQALYHRERTGEGQFVDTSIINMGFLYNSSTFVRADGSGPERPRLDADQMGLNALYRLYETADGWLCLAAIDEDAWQALVAVIDDAVLMDARFADAAARSKHDDDLAKVLTRAFATRTAAAWFFALDGGGVPCELEDADFPVRLFDDPELIARGLVASYRHPSLGHLEQAGHLVELSGTPGLIERPAPIVGQHSGELLLEYGYTQPEIDDLIETGVVAVA